MFSMKFTSVFRIHDISADPWLWLMDPDPEADPDSDPNPDPNPAIFVFDLQDAKIKLI